MQLFKRTSKQSLRESRSRERLRPAQQQARTFSYSSSATRFEGGANTGRGSGGIQERALKSRAKLRRFLINTPVIIAVLIIIGCVISQLLLTSSAKVISVSSGPSSELFLRDASVYQLAAAKLLDKSVFNRTKLTVNVGEVRQKLQAQFPELADVSVTLPVFGHRPLVYVQPSVPVFLLNTAHGSYVIDDRGKALIAEPNVAQSAVNALPMVTDQSGVVATIGKTALPSSNVAFIQTILAQLRSQNFQVKSVVLPSAASEVDVFFKNVPFMAKFNLQNDPLQQVGTFIAVTKRIKPSQYVDVRIDGRAYYK